MLQTRALRWFNEQEKGEVRGALEKINTDCTRADAHVCCFLMASPGSS